MSEVKVISQSTWYEKQFSGVDSSLDNSILYPCSHVKMQSSNHGQAIVLSEEETCLVVLSLNYKLFPLRRTIKENMKSLCTWVDDSWVEIWVSCSFILPDLAIACI